MKSLLLALWGTLFCSLTVLEGRPPNIVLIMADDLGAETIGCYGGKDYRTPRLDQLAAKGVRFENCFSQPICNPSRVQLMTGRYNQRNYEGFGYLNPKEISFGKLLRDAGYATCIAGKWQLGGNADTINDFGFDEHCLWNMNRYQRKAVDAGQPKSWLNRYWASTFYQNGKWVEHGKEIYGPDVCANFIGNFIGRHKKRPFLIYYPMILPHDPFEPTPDSRKRGGKDKKQNFTDMVEYMDKIVGKVVDDLKRHGVWEDTLFIFTGDNGTSKEIQSATRKHGVIQGGKGKMTDAGTKVPLIVYWKGRSLKGESLSSLVDFSDFLPTLCDAAGVALPKDRVLDGRSFVPVLSGDRAAERDWVFSHYWSPNGRKPNRKKEWIRNQRWKLYSDGKLFDLEKDPMEKKPVADNPEVMKIRRYFTEQLQAIHARKAHR